ncbi:Drug resistance transporter, EmrB/QacA family [Frankia sp. Hr75.2]|nr:Drug resistance transporter, EmrB/QacA family [Frankia sp. Hr75.2]
MLGMAPSTGRSRWLAFAVLCSAQLMIIIDTSIVTVALRSIQRDLGFSQSGLAWVVNAYTIAFGGLLLLSGRLGDLLGRKRVFVAGLVLFTGASMLCGVSGSQELLIAARFIQGVGGAMAAAVVMGIVVTIFRDPRDQAKAIAAFSFVSAAGGSIGVLAGGVITEGISWHWIFFINAPFGIIAAVLAVPLIETDRGLGLREGVDAVGAVLVTAGLMLGVYTIVKVSENGWVSAHTLGFGAVAVVLIAGFIVRQATATAPLVPPRIVRSPDILGANSAQVLMIAGTFAFNFLGALFLQQILGYSPVRASFAFLPIALILAIVSLGFAARLITRFGSPAVLFSGLVLIAATLGLAARTPMDANYFVDILPMTVTLGAGSGLAMPAIMTLAMKISTPSDAGTASGLAGTSGMIGGALGLAVMSTLAASRTSRLIADGQSSAAALTGGYHFAFGVAGLVVASAAALAAIMARNASVRARRADATAVPGSVSMTVDATEGPQRADSQA